MNNAFTFRRRIKPEYSCELRGFFCFGGRTLGLAVYLHQGNDAFFGVVLLYANVRSVQWIGGASYCLFCVETVFHLALKTRKHDCFFSASCYAAALLFLRASVLLKSLQQQYFVFENYCSSAFAYTKLHFTQSLSRSFVVFFSFPYVRTSFRNQNESSLPSVRPCMRHCSIL